MSEFKRTTLVLDHKFDPQRKRHYLNDKLSVLHCHHYSTLYTQLALDAGETGLLSDVSEDTFHDALKSYFAKHEVKDPYDRLDLACQYYAAVGLGKMKVDFLGDDAGQVTVAHSHVDEGWKKKWGEYDKPVNYIGAGFIAAMFAAVQDREPRTYQATEVSSIAMGADASVFKVVSA